MTRPLRHLLILFVLLVGAATIVWASKKPTIDPAVYQSQQPAQAAERLIEIARTLAGDGSYENIAVGRVLYLTGHKADGQAIFDQQLGAKSKPGDWIRVARIYSEAGEWDKAKPLYDRVADAAPKDEDWLAEIGAQYLLAGDRAHAEELFGRSFAQDPSNRANALKAAGAYLGLAPRE